MPLRSPLARLAVTAAATALLATAVAPAVALAGPDTPGAPGAPAAGPGPAGGHANPPAPHPTPTPTPTPRPAGQSAPRPTAPAPAPAASSATSRPPVGGTTADRAFYRGRVTARGGLALRSRADRGSRVLRVARQGETVWIYCKTNGSNVSGNHLWYLLADGAWTWGSARFIDNVGPSPRWC
ncbi:SH3 domain-containing protein [Streptomyces sp. NPDC056160]|uniref:SH3 domain-containing protein n=1 Tax=Streptomyces sp. NPDC056160 TaxID=3345731 RepID=UPI0035E315E7